LAGGGRPDQRERQRKLLEQQWSRSGDSTSVIEHGEELAAETCGSRLGHWASLLGRVDVEDLLDVIFRDFCIGK